MSDGMMLAIEDSQISICFCASTDINRMAIINARTTTTTNAAPHATYRSALVVVTSLYVVYYA